MIQVSHKISDRSPVSVIIIFLNAERFIREAIESVFAQTYENWELLLVDDGSTDASTDIALSYVKRGKVRYLEHSGHQNRGMSASRNLGINNAKGEYVAFIDADDVWLPSKLEEQLRIMEIYPEAAMVYGRAQKWHSWGENSKGVESDSIQAGLGVQPDTLVKPPTLATFFLQDVGIPSPSGILARHRAIEAVGGFEESFGYKCAAFEDAACYVKICLEAPVFVADQCWYRHRLHPNSCCALVIKTGQYQSARLLFLIWAEDYLSKCGLCDGEVWETLKRELWPYRHRTLHHLLSSVRHGAKQVKMALKFGGRQILPF